jgi:hypothetical protein
MRKAFGLSFIKQVFIVLGCLYGAQFFTGLFAASAPAQRKRTAHSCIRCMIAVCLHAPCACMRRARAWRMHAC